MYSVQNHYCYDLIFGDSTSGKWGIGGGGWVLGQQGVKVVCEGMDGLLSCPSCIDGAYSPEWWFSMPAKVSAH